MIDWSASTPKVFHPGAISIPENRLLRMQGYKVPENVRKAIRKAATAAARLAEDVVEPQIHYQYFEIQHLEGETLELANGTCFHCPAFPKYLSGCTSIIANVLTLGQAFDDRIAQMIAEEDLLGVLFLDNAGWLAVESATQSFVQYLKSNALTADTRLTRRLGPGYSYRSNKILSEWDLLEQPELFELFNDYELPVSLLESGAMLPRMSRSGIYGLQVLA